MMNALTKDCLNGMSNAPAARSLEEYREELKQRLHLFPQLSRSIVPLIDGVDAAIAARKLCK